MTVAVIGPGSSGLAVLTALREHHRRRHARELASGRR